MVKKVVNLRVTKVLLLHNTYAQNSKKFLDKTAKDRVYAWIPKLENINDMIVSPKEILGDMRDHYQNETHDKYYQSNLDEIKTFLDKSSENSFLCH